MQHCNPILAFKPLIPLLPTLYELPLYPLHRLMLLAVFLYLLLPPPPESLKVLQSRSIKLPRFISSNPVDLIYIQESNLKSSFSFLIPRFSALRSDSTHPLPGIPSPDTKHASGGFAFSSTKAYLLKFLPSLFLCLTPTLIM